MYLPSSSLPDGMHRRTQPRGRRSELPLFIYFACRVASCPTVGDPMDPSPPGFSVHGILQARILEWVAMSSSGGSSGSRNSKLCLPQLLHCRGTLHLWTTGELVVHQLPWRPSGKESTGNAGDAGSTPGSGRSPGEGNGNPLQDSCLGNPVDRGAWQATVCGVAKESDTTEQLNNTKDWLRISCHLKKKLCMLPF